MYNSITMANQMNTHYISSSSYSYKCYEKSLFKIIHLFNDKSISLSPLHKFTVKEYNYKGQITILITVRNVGK